MALNWPSCLFIYTTLTSKTKGANKSFEIMLHLLDSISPTFYVQLLHTQIPKAQKRLMAWLHFCTLGSACVKAAHKHVGEIDPLRLYVCKDLNITKGLLSFGMAIVARMNTPGLKECSTITLRKTYQFFIPYRFCICNTFMKRPIENERGKTFSA